MPSTTQAGDEQPQRDPPPPERAPGSAARISATLGDPDGHAAAPAARPPAEGRAAAGTASSASRAQRPGERHQTIRPYQRIISSPPTVSSSTARDGDAAVSSTRSSVGGDPQVERPVDRRRARCRVLGRGGRCRRSSSAIVGQQLLVQRGGHLVAVDLDRRALGGADADRLDVHAGGGGQLRRRPSASGPPVSSPSESSTIVAEPPVAEVRRRRVGRPGRAGSPARRRSSVSAARIAWPSEVPPPTVSRSIAAIASRVVVGRLLGGQRALAERDHADVHRVRLRLDEARRGGLRRRRAGSARRRRRAMLLDTSKASITVPVGRGRASVACGRARAKQQHRQRGEQQRERQVPAPPDAPAAAGERPARRADAAAAAVARPLQPRRTPTTSAGDEHAAPPSSAG